MTTPSQGPTAARAPKATNISSEKAPTTTPATPEEIPEKKVVPKRAAAHERVANAGRAKTSTWSTCAPVLPRSPAAPAARRNAKPERAAVPVVAQGAKSTAQQATEGTTG